MQCYGDAIPRGSTGFFQLSEDIIAIEYRNKTIVFAAKNGNHMTVRTLLESISSVDILSIQLPSLISDVLDVNIKDVKFDPAASHAIYISAELQRTIHFFNELISMDAPIITLIVDEGDVNIEMLGNITLSGTQVELKLTYSADTDQFSIFSEFSSTSLSIGNILDNLTALSLPLPSKFSSSRQRFKIAGTFDEQSDGTVLISASIDSLNRAYLILQRDNNILDTAIAVDFTRIGFSEMIRSVTGLNVLSTIVPFIDSIVVAETGLAISTGSISSGLVRECFNTSRTLRCFGATIPSGSSGFFRFSNIIFQIVNQRNKPSFTIKKGSVSVRDLLEFLPLLDVSSVRLPSAIKEILNIAIKDFGFNLIEETTFITIEFGRTLDFFNGLISIDAPIITLIVDEGDVNIEILGNITLAGTQVELKLTYSADTDQFSVSSEFSSTSLSIENVIKALTTLSLPLSNKFNSSLQTFKITGTVDNLSNGVIIISSSTKTKSQVFLILKRDNGTLETAIAVHFADVLISDVILSVTGLDVSSFPLLGTLFLPEVGFAISTGSIELLSECFNSSKILQFYDGTIPNGASGFFHISGNLIKIDYRNATVSFLVKQGSFKTGDFLRLLSVDSSRIRLPSVIRSILSINIKDFGLDLISETTFITVSYDRTINIFNGLISIDAPIITLIIDEGDVNIEILGSITLAGTQVELKLIYSADTDQFSVFSDFRSSSLSFASVIKELTSLSLPLPSKFSSTLQTFKIAGTFDQHVSNGILVISVSIGNQNRAFLILKNESNKFETTIALDIASVMLSDVIQSVTGRDLSSLPFVGSASLPKMGLAISPSPISSKLLLECFNNTLLLQCYGDTIPKGYSGYVEFDFSNDVYNITYSNELMTFTTKNGDLNVRNVLDLVLASLDVQRVVRIPNFLGNIFETGINDFGLDLMENNIFVDFELGDLNLFGGLIRISAPSIALNVSLNNSNVAVEVRNGVFVFASVEFEFQITQQNGKYTLNANCENIQLSSLVAGFSAKLLPAVLQPLTQTLNFLNFEIVDFSMVLPLDANFSQVFLSGKPTIAGYTVVCMTATVVKDQYSNEIDVVVELNFGSTNLAGVIGEIAPFVSDILRHLPFLNQDIDLALITSPKRVADLSLSEGNEHLIINKGITIKAEIPFPSSSSCGADPFCKFLSVILPSDTILYLDSTIINKNDFQLIASLTGDISLGGLTITHAGMELRVGDEDTSIGIIGKMSLRNPRLDFTIRLFFSQTGMVLELTAAGCWRDALGLPIDICNVRGSFGIGPSTAITELSLGGEIHLGGKCGLPPLIAIGYVGLNTMEPQKNYYYAHFPNGLTIKSLLQILCISINSLPSMIANTGFQPGFITSFNGSPLAKVFPELDLYIPPGFNLNGAVNIFGFVVKANVSITPSEGMYVSIELQPLEVGNLFRMYASRSDRTRGPYLTADLRTNGVPKVEASGYLYVLGFSVGASLAFTKESMSATVEGRILNIVDAGINVTAPITGEFSSAEFQVRGYFKSSFFNIIHDAIDNAAEGLADVTDTAVGAAQAVFDTASGVFDSASDGLDGARRYLDRLQGEFDGAVREVDRLIRRVNSVCSTRSCRSGKYNFSCYNSQRIYMH